MFKKLGLTIFILSLVVSISYAGGVTDSNNGNKGNIFVSTGENHGANSVGEWIDASYLKGDKGDTGEQGIQGIQGEKGEQGTQGERGEQGIQGERGETGAIGEAGQDGINGVNGKDGEKGEAGQNGINGVDGKDGAKGNVGDKGDRGDKGDEGKQGQQGIAGQDGKGLDDRYEGIIEVRVLETRKTIWSVYTGRDFNNDVNIVGAKFTYKLGRSYYEKKIDELEARLNKTEYKEPEVKVDTFINSEGQSVVRTHF